MLVSATMSLLDYLKSLSGEARTALAVKCGTSVDYLLQIAYGKRKPKAGLAVTIDRETGGRVRCETLLPQVDWAYLRGEEAATAAGQEQAA